MYSSSIPAPPPYSNSSDPSPRGVVATLNKEEGYIKIIGHTDDTPINRGNVRFPSNYQLSIERAKSVANFFKDSHHKS